MSRIQINGHLKMWYDDFNRRHREDGPAVEWGDSFKQWYINGLLHRKDGPADIRVDIHGKKTCQYYLFDHHIPEEKYLSTPIDKLILEVKMIQIIET